MRDGYSAAGKSLLEKLWDELDNIMSRLMSDGEPDINGHDIYEHDLENYKAWGEERGQAQGIAYAIAIIENPYQPNMPGVKARAVERWEAGQ